MQRGDERPPLLLIGALGEQLLELVDHQQQPRLRDALARSCRIPAGPPGWARAAWRAVRANPAGSASSPCRTAAASAPAIDATRTASSSSGARVGVNTRHGQTPIPARTPARPPGSAAAPPPAAATTCRPPTPRTPPAGRPVQAPRHPLQDLRGGRFTAEKERRVPLLERAQSAVRRTGLLLRKLSRLGLAAGRTGDITRQGRWRRGGEGSRHLARGGERLGSPRAPPRRRDKQLAHRPGQAQRIGQEHGGILAGGTVDPPLQITDRPRAHGRRLRQFLLSQPGLGPQQPQQPSKTQARLLRHNTNAPSRGHRPLPNCHRLRCGQDFAPTVRGRTLPRYLRAPSQRLRRAPGGKIGG